MRILYTGFEPFGGETINSSYEALKLLPERIAGTEAVVRTLPVAYGRAARLLEETVRELRPACVISVGQAAGRAMITPEYVAINVRDARIPDNDGFQPRGEKIDETGPDAYFTRLPVRRIVDRLQREGLPAELSYTAGTFVCNDLMYALLRLAQRDYPNMAAGFIHVPCSPEQAGARGLAAPGMGVRRVAEALRVAGEESLAGR